MALDVFKDGAFNMTNQTYPLHFFSLIFRPLKENQGPQKTRQVCRIDPR